jgi:kynurenine formamidase
MAQIDSVLVGMESFVNNAEVVKSIVVDRMKIEGLITEDQAKEFSEKWQVIIIKRKWYKKWWKKYFDNEPDDDGMKDKEGNSYQYKLVKFED